MYVCMYVCMYVWYVCMFGMYVCMYGRHDRRIGKMAAGGVTTDLDAAP